MTDRRKFQRRKRGEGSAPVRSPPKPRPGDDQGAPASAPPQKAKSAAEIEALRARRAELLRLKAEKQKRAAARSKESLKSTANAPEPRSAPAARVRSPGPPLILAQAPARDARVPPPPDPEETWERIDTFDLDAGHLERNRVITARRDDPAYSRFDILRTRMLQALSDNGWKRIAITSPTKGCGKTFTAANLAISLARQENCRAVLLDLDMRNPTLHKVFGVTDPGSIGDFLRGRISAERQLQRFAPNTLSAGQHMAIGFNGIVEPYAAELIQDPASALALRRLEETLAPDVILFDLPPALINDDVLAMRPHFDAILLVAGGGLTSARDIKETERRLGEKVPLLGVVLNKSDPELGSTEAY